MKKQDLPQDESNLKSANMTEVLYVTDENDNYTTANSIGWEAKKAALEELIANTPRWPSGLAWPTTKWRECCPTSRTLAQRRGGQTTRWTWGSCNSMEPP